jgi:hypothetical protein
VFNTGNKNAEGGRQVRERRAVKAMGQKNPITNGRYNRRFFQMLIRFDSTGGIWFTLLNRVYKPLTIIVTKSDKKYHKVDILYIIYVFLNPDSGYKNQIKTKLNPALARERRALSGCLWLYGIKFALLKIKY